MSLKTFWKRFRLRVILSLVGIGVVCVLAGILVSDEPIVVVLLFGVAVWLVWDLIRRVERPARDLRRFLEGVRYDDFTLRFPKRGGSLTEGLAAAFDDVNEIFRRVRAEREEQATYLEAVVRHVGVGLIAFTSDGAVTLFNTTARRTLGVPRPQTLDALEEWFPKAGEALRSIRPGERVLLDIDRDGSPLELAAYATRLLVGETDQMLVSLQDIHTELEVRELDAWKDLTRVLTHEISNSVAPIASLAGTVTNLLEKEAPNDLADAREALATIERRSRGLVSFVEAYQSLARVPSPELQVVPAADIVGGVTTLLRTTATERGVELAASVEPPDTEFVADPELVEQALVNLVLNAVEAIDEGGGNRVAIRAFPGSDGHGIIEVTDDGPGLEPEVVEKAFVPFFTTKTGGSGIGLTLANRIARLHGGSLAVSSEPGERTTFTLRL